MVLEQVCCKCGKEALAQIAEAWYCFSCGIEFHPIGLPHGRPCQACAKAGRERDEWHTQYDRCFAELVAAAKRASLAERDVLDAQRERDAAIKERDDDLVSVKVMADKLAQERIAESNMEIKYEEAQRERDAAIKERDAACWCFSHSGASCDGCPAEHDEVVCGKVPLFHSIHEEIKERDEPAEAEKDAKAESEPTDTQKNLHRTLLAAHRRITGMERDFRERLSLLEGERSRAVARLEELARMLLKEQRDHQQARNRACDAERDLADAKKKIVELDNDRKDERREHLSDHNRVVDAESKRAAVLAEVRFSECSHCGWTGYFGSERECPCCHGELSPIHLSITDVLRRLQRTPRVS